MKTSKIYLENKETEVGPMTFHLEKKSILILNIYLSYYTL